MKNKTKMQQPRNNLMYFKDKTIPFDTKYAASGVVVCAHVYLGTSSMIGSLTWEGGGVQKNLLSFLAGNQL